MKKLLSLFIITSLFAGELEVEGNLTVTEVVNASSFNGDGSGLTNLPSLSGMKPDRIYRFSKDDGATFNLIVPANKLWFISCLSSYNGQINVNSQIYSVYDYRGGQSSFWAISGDVIANCSGGSSCEDPLLLNIFEYSISGSGTDQGMDYIEP